MFDMRDELGAKVSFELDSTIAAVEKQVAARRKEVEREVRKVAPPGEGLFWVHQALLKDKSLKTLRAQSQNRRNAAIAANPKRQDKQLHDALMSEVVGLAGRLLIW